jgi:hypothetical protein
MPKTKRAAGLPRSPASASPQQPPSPRRSAAPASSGPGGGSQHGSDLSRGNTPVAARLRVGRISKQGDRCLRRLLLVGATAVIRHSREKARPGCLAARIAGDPPAPRLGRPCRQDGADRLAAPDPEATLSALREPAGRRKRGRTTRSARALRDAQRSTRDETPRRIHRASKRAMSIRDLVGGCPSRPATTKMPREQAGHRKATNPRMSRTKPSPIGRPHTKQISTPMEILRGSLGAENTLGVVWIHLSQSLAQARCTKAMKAASVFSHRRAIRRERLRRLKRFRSAAVRHRAPGRADRGASARGSTGFAPPRPEPVPDKLPEMVCLTGRVRDHRGQGCEPSDPLRRLGRAHRPTARASARPQRQAERVHAGVQLGGQAAARSADPLTARPPFAPVAAAGTLQIVQSTKTHSKSGAPAKASKRPSQTPAKAPPRKRAWTEVPCRTRAAGRAKASRAPRACQSTASRTADCLRRCVRAGPSGRKADARSAPRARPSGSVCSRSPPFPILNQSGRETGIPNPDDA